MVRTTKTVCVENMVDECAISKDKKELEVLCLSV